ncbi:hypothetical protein GGR34_003923, partial [Microvirga flocculans]|nr:hypothetical protein [Microvirga flocculans]
LAFERRILNALGPDAKNLLTAIAKLENIFEET